jgi:cyclopropane fatty-acyl-phospholipid synthase-like methyltransferase
VKKDLHKVHCITLIIFVFLCLHVLPVLAEPQSTNNPAAQMRFQDINYWLKVFEDPERDSWQQPDEVVKKMNIGRRDVVVDIGAGTGYFTRRFAVAAPEGRAIGLDIEQSMVRYMQEDAIKLGLKNYSARIVKTDDPQIEKKSVDIVFLCNTYHHIENRKKYFKEVAEGLKDGGRLIIVDFYKKELPYGPPPSHKLSKEIVIAELQDGGYRLRTSLKFLPYQYYLEFDIKKHGLNW